MSSTGMGLQSYIEPPNTELKIVPPPGWLIGHDGGLATFMDASKLDRSQGQVHLLCPSGIGDVAWIWARYWKLHEDLKAQRRELIWHFPNDDNKRVRPYAKLVGMNIGEFLNIDIRQLLSYPGEFEPGDFDEGAILYIHANRHIEEGNPLHDGAPKYDAQTNNKTWTPWLPFKNPAPPVMMVEGNCPPHTGTDAGVWQYADKAKSRKPYFVVHMASANYCEGNYMPRQWARMVEKMEKYAPVSLVGARWDEALISEVCKFYCPSAPILTGQTFSTVLSRICNSTAMVGVDSGLTILGTYYGLPVLRGYPRWLQLMPGTFEDPETLHKHNKPVFMDEVIDELDGWLEGLEIV